MQIEDSIEAVEESLSPAAQRTQELIDQVLGLLPLLVVALVAVLLFWSLGAFLGSRRWLTRRLSRGSELIDELLRRVIPVVFILLGVVFALNILDAVAILSAILGAAGVVGIAVGFAIRDTIENFIASVMLSVRQPFRPKDYVAVDSHEGFVVRLTSRATILLTADGVSVRIPNAQVFKAVIVNYSRNPERRIPFVLGVDAEDDPLAAMEAGLVRLRALPFTMAEPTPQAWIDEVGDSSILITFAFWIRLEDTDFFKAKSAGIRAVKMELEERGFTLPEPIYRLRIDQLPEGLEGTLREAAPQAVPGPGGRAGAPKRTRKAPAAELDTSRDRAMEAKVDEDRREGAGEDLLDETKPTEFGDEPGPAARADGI